MLFLSPPRWLPVALTSYYIESLDHNPWPGFNFSLQYHHRIKHSGHYNKGNERQPKKLLIVSQILLVSTLRNVWSTVWRICILILELNDLRKTILTLECRAQEIPPVYLAIWVKRKIYLCIPKEPVIGNHLRGRGWWGWGCRLCQDKIYQIPS